MMVSSGRNEAKLGRETNMIPWWESVLRLVLAMILGGLIGWEREKESKPAGFRTQMLVSLAAAVYVMAAHEMAFRYDVPMDPVRAMSGIASGVGFLGAGAIVQRRQRVHSLTTAAALWASAAIGLAVGLGIYQTALLGAILTYIVLEWLAVVERHWFEDQGKED